MSVHPNPHITSGSSMSVTVHQTTSIQWGIKNRHEISHRLSALPARDYSANILIQFSSHCLSACAKKRCIAFLNDSKITCFLIYIAPTLHYPISSTLPTSSEYCGCVCNRHPTSSSASPHQLYLPAPGRILLSSALWLVGADVLC